MMFRNGVGGLLDVEMRYNSVSLCFRAQTRGRSVLKRGLSVTRHEGRVHVYLLALGCQSSSRSSMAMFNECLLLSNGSIRISSS